MQHRRFVAQLGQIRDEAGFMKIHPEHSYRAGDNTAARAALLDSPIEKQGHRAYGVRTRGA